MLPQVERRVASSLTASERHANFHPYFQQVGIFSMYDLRSLREQLPAIRDQLGPRGADVAWEEVEKLLQDRRDRLSQVEALRHQLKKGSDDVARLKRANQPAEDSPRFSHGHHAGTRRQYCHP